LGPESDICGGGKDHDALVVRMLLVVECDVSGSGRDHDALVVRMLLVVECGLRRMGPVESDADELIYKRGTGRLH